MPPDWAMPMFKGFAVGVGACYLFLLMFCALKKGFQPIPGFILGFLALVPTQFFIFVPSLAWYYLGGLVGSAACAYILSLPKKPLC